MKVRKGLFSVFLSVVMILGLASTAFAKTHDESPAEPNYEFYVPMGTSITGGYRLPGDGTGGTVGKPDGVFSNEYTYAYLVGKEFNIPEHYSGAILGSRTLEYRMLLEEDFPEENVDNYNDIWVGPRCGNDYNHLHNELGPVYRENLAKADLISVEIGLNDVTSYAMCTVMTELEEKVAESGEADIFAYLQTLSGESGTVTGEEMLGILAIADYFGAYEEILTTLTNYFIEGMETYRTNFPIVLQDIRKINPTADLFVVGVYNPLDYMLDHEITANENGNIDIKNLILSTGETLSLTQEQTTWLFTLMEEYVVGAQNLVMQSACRDNNATFVNVQGIDLSGSADGTHPYVAGHAYIADHLSSAIYSLYPCQHQHLTTSGAVIPTSSSSRGYTGDIVCADCEKVIAAGKNITYQEYMNMQPNESIPSAADVREKSDPIVQVKDPVDMPKDGENYIIAYNNRALSITENKGYTGSTTVKESFSWGEGNTYEFETTTNIQASGLDVKNLKLGNDGKIDRKNLTNDMLWTFESVGENTFKIKNYFTGQYLEGSYNQSSGWGWGDSSATATAKLFLKDETDCIWTYDGSNLFSTVTVNNGWRPTTSTQYLSYESSDTAPAGYKGYVNFFTAIQEPGDESTIALYNVQPKAPTEYTQEALFAEAKNMLGKCIEWKRCGIGEGNYVLIVNNQAIGLDGKNIVVKTISNSTEIGKLDKSFQWKVEATDSGFSFENIGFPGYYLSAHTETDLLTTKASLIVGTAPYSWQFSNNQLYTSVNARGILNISIENMYFMSCANGYLTLASDAACDVTKLYQAVKSLDTHTKLEESFVQPTKEEAGSYTLSCSACGATVTVVIPPLEPQEEKYAITVTGGTASVEKATAGTTITLTADKAKEGFKFAGWKVTPSDVEIKDNTFTMPESDVTVEALFEEIKEEEEIVVELDQTSADFAIGKTLQLSATVTPSTADQNVTWESSNKNVATVSNDGFVTAEGYGKAIITATSLDGSASATCEIQTRFADVAGSGDKSEENYQYYYNPIYWAADHDPAITTGYTSGDYAGCFGVGLGCTREDFSTFIYRLAGTPDVDPTSIDAVFTDSDLLSNTSVKKKAVAWAYKNGIVKGYDDGRFGVGKKINRREAMIMIWRYKDKPQPTSYSLVNSFTDMKQYGSTTDSYKSIAWAAENGITNGLNASQAKEAGLTYPCFGCDVVCAREQMITFLYRAFAE